MLDDTSSHGVNILDRYKRWEARWVAIGGGAGNGRITTVSAGEAGRTAAAARVGERMLYG